MTKAPRGGSSTDKGLYLCPRAGADPMGPSETQSIVLNGGWKEGEVKATGCLTVDDGLKLQIKSISKVTSSFM